MFSLIISIIAIALVSALAIASIYYGGSALNKGTIEIDATEFINQGEQVKNAILLKYANKDTAVRSINDLVPNYLTEVPKYKGVSAWNSAFIMHLPDGRPIHRTISYKINEDVCQKINEKSGISTNPSFVMNTINPTEYYGQFGCYWGNQTGNERAIMYYDMGFVDIWGF